MSDEITIINMEATAKFDARMLSIEGKNNILSILNLITPEILKSKRKIPVNREYLKAMLFFFKKLKKLNFLKYLLKTIIPIKKPKTIKNNLFSMVNAKRLINIIVEAKVKT